MKISNDQKEKLLQINEETNRMLIETEYKMNEIINKLEEYGDLNFYNLHCVKKNINKINYLLKHVNNINTILYDELRDGVVKEKDN